MTSSLEHKIEQHFREYYDMTEGELFDVLRLTPTFAKSRLHLITKGIIERFEDPRAFAGEDFELKTVRFESDGSLKESMSFKQIDYEEIIHEEWQSSYWHLTLRKRFMFVIFQKDGQQIVRLQKVKFWSMPETDLETARQFWEHTRRNIQANDFEHFIAQSDDYICHVRPKARNSRDLAPTANGGVAKKKAYWLNSDYIRQVIKS